MFYEQFSNEQSRAVVNLQQAYAGWIDAERRLLSLPYNLQIKQSNGASYLYEVLDGRGNAKSLGRLDHERQERYDSYHAEKALLKDHIKGSRETLESHGRVWRALRLPMLSNEAGDILRAADRLGMLDGELMVVGTNALPAYAMEANGFIRDAPEETEDFDLAWTKAGPSSSSDRVWPMLKSVDSTFTLNTERTFQARNRKAYEVELLVAPSRADGLATKDQPIPVPLPEQEWLLLGKPVDHVVACRNMIPARLVVPDPRYFALHKLWMADKLGRNPLKKPKDRMQGRAILAAVDEAMPHYPLDEAFREGLPGELLPHYDRWRETAPKPQRRDW